MSDDVIDGECEVLPASAGEGEAVQLESKSKRRQKTVTVPAGLIKQEPVTEPQTPMSLIAMAVQQGFDVDKLERLLTMKREWDRDEARKAFYAALSKFQAELPPICRADRVEHGLKTGGKMARRYASLGTINEAIRPYLYANGLSFRFQQKQGPDGITVTCIVSHKDGHSEETTLTAGADGSGGKNAIQSVGSTITYLERYTLTAALGLTTVEEDDDGEQGPASVPSVPLPAAPAPVQQATAPLAPPATPVVGPQKPMVTAEQGREMVRLAKELFASSDAFTAWLLEHFNTSDANELTEAEADGVNSALNLLKHQMVTPAPLPPEPQPKPQDQTAGITQFQRDRIRDLTVENYGANAGDEQDRWLQSLGYGAIRSVTFLQAAERISALEGLVNQAGQGETITVDNLPF